MRHCALGIQYIAFLLLLAFAGMAGCGGGGNKLVNPLDRTGSITIEISRSTTPEFSWTSDVAVEAISVWSFSPAGAPDRILWGYRNVSLKPPVTYGAKLNGISLGLGTAPPLQSGVRYRVQVVQNNAASHADWIVP